MNNKKIKTLIALAITTSVIASANLNTTVASAYTKDVSINSESTSNGQGIAGSVYEKLIEKGWTKDSTGALTLVNNAFKFRNLNGVNGKDASVIIKCDDPEYDHYILELLELMIGDQSSLTAMELARIIGNGTSVIQDGSRFINVQYDGSVDYTITITFYNYGYTPSYIMPSLDNYEMISALEDLINEKVLCIPDLYNSWIEDINKIIWGGSKKHPIKLMVDTSINSNIDNLTNRLNAVSKNINSVKVTEENNDKVIIELKVNLENFLYHGKYRHFIYLNLEIDKSNTYAIDSINNFMNSFVTEDNNNDQTVDSDNSSEDTNPELPSDDIDEIPGDNDGSVTPPSVDTDDQEDTTTTPSEDDNSQKDDETVDSDNSSEDTNPELPSNDIDEIPGDN
ncbi:hypothetical protein, partial [Clostridium cuniculi]|uniref:hypothetical protein n=1 Tax=Clostridium cuniculi TaxID=2548455 RepID=UPI00195AA066